MSVLQVVLQQLGGPDRGMITRLAGIAGEGRRNPGVDDLGDRRGAARPRGVEQACPELEVVAPEEAVDPVVDGLTADLERLGDLLGGEPLGEPEHRLARDTAPWPKGSGARGLPVPHTGEHSR